MWIPYFTNAEVEGEAAKLSHLLGGIDNNNNNNNDDNINVSSRQLSLLATCVRLTETPTGDMSHLRT